MKFLKVIGLIVFILVGILLVAARQENQAPTLNGRENINRENVQRKNHNNIEHLRISTDGTVEPVSSLGSLPTPPAPSRFDKAKSDDQNPVNIQAPKK